VLSPSISAGTLGREGKGGEGKKSYGESKNMTKTSHRFDSSPVEDGYSRSIGSVDCNVPSDEHKNKSDIICRSHSKDSCKERSKLSRHQEHIEQNEPTLQYTVHKVVTGVRDEE
jgi:hypothetical protein